MSVDCWLNEEEQIQTSSYWSGDSCFLTNDSGGLQVANSSVSSKSSSSIMVGTPMKTTVVEGVLHTAASMLASLVLGVDLRTYSSSSSRYVCIYIT